MKSLVVSLLALMVPAATFAITPGTSASVTLALTASIQSGGFKVTDPNTNEVVYEEVKYTSKESANGDVVSETTERKSVITAVRYGNAQILSDLNEQGLLDGTITGWSIVNIAIASDDESGDDSATGPALYAVKKSQVPVAIEISLGEVAWAEASTSKYTIDYVTDKETFIASGSDKGVVSLGLADFFVQGVVTGTSKYVSGSLGKGQDAVSYETYLDGALKVAAFSGTYSLIYVAEGSLSLSPAKVVDLEALGFAPAY